jgi:hypothetical protein
MRKKKKKSEEVIRMMIVVKMTIIHSNSHTSASFTTISSLPSTRASSGKKREMEMLAPRKWPYRVLYRSDLDFEKRLGFKWYKTISVYSVLRLDQNYRLASPSSVKFLFGPSRKMIEGACPFSLILMLLNGDIRTV